LSSGIDGLIYTFSARNGALTHAKENTMPNVFVEPQPKGRPEGTAITHYVLELAGGKRLDQTDYKTQKEAIDAARAHKHDPLVARVRNTDKGNPDHWRKA
jgi:hypothetical protein